MSAFPDWHKYVVRQRNSLTGCIPTCYEILARAAKVKDVNFDTFQEDFDLGSTNSFANVAQAVQRRYPHLIYKAPRLILIFHLQV